MSGFLRRYLNELVSMAMLVLLVVALIDGQLLSRQAETDATTSQAKVVAERVR